MYRYLQLKKLNRKYKDNNKIQSGKDPFFLEALPFRWFSGILQMRLKFVFKSNLYSNILLSQIDVDMFQLQLFMVVFY